MRLPDQKRTYTKPEHEVSVRGYMRHYKSGKSVWIEPFTKYRGKGKNRKTTNYRRYHNGSKMHKKL